MAAKPNDPAWWQDFELSRAQDAAAEQDASRQERSRLIDPLIRESKEAIGEIRAALVDTTELSARDFNRMRAKAMAMAVAFGAIHDALEMMDA